MNKLWLRLSFGFLILTWAILGIAAWVVHTSVETSFSHYVTQSERARFGITSIAELEAYYAQHGSWDGVDLTAGNGERRGMMGRGGGGAFTYIATPAGTIVAASNDSVIGQSLDQIGATSTVTLKVNGKTVGLLGDQTPSSMMLTTAESTFKDETTSRMLVIAGLGGLLVFVFGFILSWSLTLPLHHLTLQVGQLSARDIGAQLEPTGTTEVRRLAQAFNRLSQRLSMAEQSRQRMASDVAHELRTPVTVMRGHLEAMMDGIYPLDTEHLSVAYDQILHMARLVEDLRLLTQAETDRLPLHLTNIDLNSLIQVAVERFTPIAEDAKVALKITVPASVPPIIGDKDRLQQVLDNLLTNAVRHTPPDGDIMVMLQVQPTRVEVKITNSGSMLSAEQIDHLFDRFWRADDARQRDAGGSGLGLAITRELLRLHRGEISVNSAQGFTTFAFTLPLD